MVTWSLMVRDMVVGIWENSAADGVVVVQKRSG